jgi:hypothetical protein
MKSRARGERKLASLRKVLERLRLGYARVLARKLKVRGDLPARILEIKAKIAKLTQDVSQRVEAA